MVRGTEAQAMFICHPDIPSIAITVYHQSCLHVIPEVDIHGAAELLEDLLVGTGVVLHRQQGIARELDPAIVNLR